MNYLAQCEILKKYLKLVRNKFAHLDIFKIYLWFLTNLSHIPVKGLRFTHLEILELPEVFEWFGALWTDKRFDV